MPEEIPRTPGRLCAVHVTVLARLDPAHPETRKRLIVTLHLKHGYTQAQIAEHLALHYAAVSRIISRQVDARNKTPIKGLRVCCRISAPKARALSSSATCRHARSTPEALAVCVAMKSISPGDRQS